MVENALGGVLKYIFIFLIVAAICSYGHTAGYDLAVGWATGYITANGLYNPDPNAGVNYWAWMFIGTAQWVFYDFLAIAFVLFVQVGVLAVPVAVIGILVEAALVGWSWLHAPTPPLALGCGITVAFYGLFVFVILAVLVKRNSMPQNPVKKRVKGGASDDDFLTTYEIGKHPALDKRNLGGLVVGENIALFKWRALRDSASGIKNNGWINPAAWLYMTLFRELQDIGELIRINGYQMSTSYIAIEGPPGTGKGLLLTLMILEWCNGGLCVYDPAGEFYEKCAGIRKERLGRGAVVINPSLGMESASINVLTAICGDPKATDFLARFEILMGILAPKKTDAGANQIFEDKGRTILEALLMDTLESNPGDCCLSDVMARLFAPESDVIRDLTGIYRKGRNAATYAASVMPSESDGKEGKASSFQSFLGNATNQLKSFANPILSSIVSGTTNVGFHPQDVIQGVDDLYLQFDAASIKTTSAIPMLILQAITESMTNCKRPVAMIIDEAPMWKESLGDFLESSVAQYRKRGLCIVAVYQSMAQAEFYWKERAKSLLDMCNVKCYLSVSGTERRKEFAERWKWTQEIRSGGSSSSQQGGMSGAMQAGSTSYNVNVQGQEVPLIPVAEPWLTCDNNIPEEMLIDLTNAAGPLRIRNARFYRHWTISKEDKAKAIEATKAETEGNLGAIAQYIPDSVLPVAKAVATAVKLISETPKQDALATEYEAADNKRRGWSLPKLPPLPDWVGDIATAVATLAVIGGIVAGGIYAASMLGLV